LGQGGANFCHCYCSIYFALQFCILPLFHLLQGAKAGGLVKQLVKIPVAERLTQWAERKTAQQFPLGIWFCTFLSNAHALLHVSNPTNPTKGPEINHLEGGWVDNFNEGVPCLFPCLFRSQYFWILISEHYIKKDQRAGTSRPVTFNL
jgi:hypothetical protein